MVFVMSSYWFLHQFCSIYIVVTSPGEEGAAFFVCRPSVCAHFVVPRFPLFFNPYKSSGLVHPYQLGEPFPILGVSGVFFSFLLYFE